MKKGFSKGRGLVAVVVCAAFAAGAVQPAAAAPIPVAKAIGDQTLVETVQYRPGRPPVRVKRRGGNGAAAAAIIGALAVGAAAVAVSQAEKRRQRRADREAYYYGGGGYAPYGYAQPQPYYAPQPRVYYPPQPQYYQAPPQQLNWRQHRSQPSVDTSSPYVLQQQRQQWRPRQTREEWNRAHRTLPSGVQDPYPAGEPYNGGR